MLRRMLGNRGRMTGNDTAPDGGRKVRGGILVLGLALAAAVAAIGYRSLDGSASDEAQPPAEQGPPTIEELQRRAEAAPEDPRAWQELGFARFDRGEFAEAAAAYRRAVENAPEQAMLWSALGEALVMASERDPMPPEALAAFRKAAELDPADPRARYFLAVKRDLDGDHAGAIADWLDLLEDTPPGAPWEGDLARTIEQVGKINGIDTAPRIAVAEKARRDSFGPVPGGAEGQFQAGAAIPGPTAQDIAAASAIPPGEQRQMAEGMVASLESKLAANPANIDGWVMLMRSRMTLGQPDRASKALADALAANPGAAQRLRSEAELLGVR